MKNSLPTNYSNSNFIPGVHESGKSVARNQSEENKMQSNRTGNLLGGDPLDELISDMNESVQYFNNEPNRGNTLSAPVQSPESEATAKYSFLSIEYYQQFFNVDTVMVIDRIASSMIPKRAPFNYLRSHIGMNPDLYGPFWIIITLVFSIGISGNLASYIQAAFMYEFDSNQHYQWRYNFHLVSIAATAIIMYACLIPLTLWVVLKWSSTKIDDGGEGNTVDATAPSLLSLICLYGYSLAIYIPVSILWVIQISFLQWLLVITAAVLSGSVLIYVLMPAIKQSPFYIILMMSVGVAHFILAAGFMLYFFHVPASRIDTLPAAPQSNQH